MALIENLEHDGWEAFLRTSFRFALEVLKEDRFRPAGSSVDDLKSWLTAGGIARVRFHLAEQMKMRRFSRDRMAAVINCLEKLVDENRGALLHLMADGIVPGSAAECLAACGFSETEFHELLDRMTRGERPFEEWMREHGHTDEEIAHIFREIDKWLARSGILPRSFSPPNAN